MANIAAIKEILEIIESQPTSWNQLDYVSFRKTSPICRTAYCIAGYALKLYGDKQDEEYIDNESLPYSQRDKAIMISMMQKYNILGFSIPHMAAKTILELDYNDANVLFSEHNTFSDLKHMLSELEIGNSLDETIYYEEPDDE